MFSPIKRVDEFFKFKPTEFYAKKEKIREMYENLEKCTHVRENRLIYRDII